MFALIDCNNFYASCERLFRPDLSDKPIIILSNNDGCIIARSNEAKALGIKMGEPFFKARALCNQHKVNVFSSNYALYGDLSSRVMSVIQSQWNETEIYSIDEAFLDLGALPCSQINSFCIKLQKLVLKNTGIPTSIGIGPTKTLAKAANYIAKKKLNIPVFNIHGQEHWLQQIDIGDIWGIGRQWQSKLNNMGVNTAEDLVKINTRLVKSKFNVVLQRTVTELRGVPCLNLEVTESKKSIMSSRSFGGLQTDYNSLRQAVSYHCATAWAKMRHQGLIAQHLSVFVRSNPFRSDLTRYEKSIGFNLLIPSDDLCYLTKNATSCLKKIFKEGVYYHKCGVLLSGLTSKQHLQLDLFHQPPEEKILQKEKIMQTLEHINQKYGARTLRLAAEGFNQNWTMRRNLKTPNYTTNWAELPIAHIGR